MSNANHRILLPHGCSTALQRQFGVTRVTVARALTYTTNTALAHDIRRAALAAGGKRTKIKINN